MKAYIAQRGIHVRQGSWRDSSRRPASSQLWVKRWHVGSPGPSPLYPPTADIP